MKKNNIIKIGIIALFILLTFFNTTYAFTIDDLTGSTKGLEKVQDAGVSVISILATIGSAASIIFMIILGIKYMLGSVEEKAQYKKTLLPYVIGAVFVFGASSIAGIIYGMFNTADEDEQQEESIETSYIQQRF